MKLQVLVSTMHQKDHSIVEKMNIQSDAVIINQCDINNHETIRHNEYNIDWYNSIERGLSRSRNNAINKARGNICMLSDDDIVYIENYEEIIIDQFKKNPEADIIAFQVEGIEGSFKNYHPRFRKVNFLTSMKISSVEIAFKLDSVKREGILFNELFGAGAKYTMGEENIFLFECLKRKLNIIYVPVKIANLHLGDSTWFNGYNKEYLINRGAAFTGMTKKFSTILILQFAIRRHKLFYPNIKLLKSIKYMLRGRRQYLIDFTD